ncbi:DUF262 domain-containing protein [Cronobacter turicensis]
MQTLNFDINQLIRKVRAGHFLIPQFQRDFTWKEAQTKLLVDSIARNYPIGSLLILGKNEDIPLVSRPIHAFFEPEEDVTIDSSINYKNEAYYVLDGQQRLTSLARVFLNAHPHKSYYFDLYKMHYSFANEDSSWIIGHTRSKADLPRKNNNRLIRADLVLDQGKSDVYISEYIEDSNDFLEFMGNKNEARKAAANIKGIFERIRKFNIPFVALDNDAPLESVCRVFETINSTGTRLTTFDLAVAKYYPKPDLKSLYETSVESLPVLRSYGIDGERILQTMSLYYLNEEQKFPEATRSILLSLLPEFIIDKWSAAAKSLADTCNWVKQLGAIAKTQPPTGLLVSIAATLMRYPRQLESYSFRKMLKKWYFCSTLGEKPSHATNYKIGDDFRNFCNFIRDEKPVSFPKVYFTSENIIGINRITDSKYKAIQALLCQSITKDLLTGEELDDNIEDHHIFPYSLHKSGIDKKLLNSIANKILISSKSNRELMDQAPEKYFNKIRSNYSDDESFFLYLDQYFIPHGKLEHSQGFYSHDKFSQFLQYRAELIIEKIKSVVEDAWSTTMTDED